MRSFLVARRARQLLVPAIATAALLGTAATPAVAADSSSSAAVVAAATTSASTKTQITFQGLTAPFENAVLQIQVRRNGNRWWARALWNDGNSGAGPVKLGTLRLRQRSSSSASWTTVKTKAVWNNGNTSFWTDDRYDPPTGYQVQAEFTASVSVSMYYPKTQRTKAVTT